MSKKQRIIDLTDRRIKGLVNRGYGMLVDGVTYTPEYITFENVYTEESPYPMYAVDLSAYFRDENIDIRSLHAIQLTASIYDEDEVEIPLEDRHQKVAFVSENALDGYSGTDILPEHNYKLIGSDRVTSLILSSYTGYKEDGICLSDFPLEDGVGFNIQLTNGDFTNLRYLRLSMLRLVFKEEDTKEPVKEANKEQKEEPTRLEEIVNGSWLADLSNPAIKGFINDGNGVITQGVSQADCTIIFENSYTEASPFPMFGVDFSQYLSEKGLSIADIKSFEIVAIPYDEGANEIDLTDEFQKCCFVSREHLNGYSQSDILQKGNYKEIGSKYNTTFDLTMYDNSCEHSLEDGVGFNLQILNGDYKNLKYLVLSKLKFRLM